MKLKIILISGSSSSSKSTLANNLKNKFQAIIFSTSKYLRFLLEADGIEDPKLEDKINKGKKLDTDTNFRWVLDALNEEIAKYEGKELFVVDAVRFPEQIDHVRSAYGVSAVTHVHLTLEKEKREQRYKDRARSGDDLEYDLLETPISVKKIKTLEDLADIVIDIEKNLEDDVLTRAASRMSLFGKNNNGYVDVIIGGQYGSEGKGQIVAFLAKEYDLLIRVGGPNAGHTIFREPKPYTHHQLPSGTLTSEAALLLGPGMVLNVEELLEEIADCSVDKDRLSIDGQAMIIQPEDVQNEEKLFQEIGSTKQGVGFASARKITERSKNNKSLAKFDKLLKPYIRSSKEIISSFIANNGRILIEGTQGIGLSLHHGKYPYVTSRDTSIAGCLSEAGIPPSLVRKVIMVCRTYPIRVQDPDKGSSGPLNETSWEEISKRSKIPLEELLKNERTSTTNRERRVGEFEWKLLKDATIINKPTDIALNFVDYLDIENRKANRVDQLTSETINLIEEIENVTEAKVSLIGTGFNPRSIIDRRKW